MKFGYALKSAVLAGAAMLLPSVAEASVTINSIGLDVGGESGILHYTPSSYATGTVGIGRIRLSGTDNVTSTAVSFAAYCIDIFTMLHNGNFNVVPLIDYNDLNAGQQALLLKLISNGDPLLNGTPAGATKTDISAALQLAVWEIAFDNALDVTTGNFYVSNLSDSNVATIANGYLQNLGIGGIWNTAQSGYALNALVAVTSESNQEQMFLINSPVPEPATWAMMISGFGLIGASLRTRRRQARIALA